MAWAIRSPGCQPQQLEFLVDPASAVLLPVSLLSEREAGTRQFIQVLLAGMLAAGHQQFDRHFLLQMPNSPEKESRERVLEVLAKALKAGRHGEHYWETTHEQVKEVWLSKAREVLGWLEAVGVVVPGADGSSTASGGGPVSSSAPEACAVDVAALEREVLRSDASPEECGRIIAAIHGLGREREEALRECGRLREELRAAQELEGGIRAALALAEGAQAEAQERAFTAARDADRWHGMKFVLSMRVRQLRRERRRLYERLGWARVKLARRPNGRRVPQLAGPAGWLP